MRTRRACIGNVECIYTEMCSQLPYVSLPSTTVVIVLPFFVIFVIFVRSAERERRDPDGDVERCDVRDDGLGNEFRPSLTLNFTLNMFLFFFFSLFLVNFHLILDLILDVVGIRCACRF